MVADALHHRVGTRVAHGKALTGHATKICFAGDRSIEHHVARNDVVGRSPRNLDDGCTEMRPPDRPLPQ